MADGDYEADGTIHVRYGRCEKINAVMFIPHQYVEQDGSKFAVFVPHDDSASSCQEGTHKAEKSLVVKAGGLDGAATGVKLCCGAKFGTPLLHAAVHHVKVTVVVRQKENFLALQEIIVPAVSTKLSTK